MQGFRQLASQPKLKGLVFLISLVLVFAYLGVGAVVVYGASGSNDEVLEIANDLSVLGYQVQAGMPYEEFAKEARLLYGRMMLFIETSPSHSMVKDVEGYAAGVVLKVAYWEGEEKKAKSSAWGKVSIGVTDDIGKTLVRWGREIREGVRNQDAL